MKCKFICDNCNREFYKYKSARIHKKTFCSRKCSAWRSNSISWDGVFQDYLQGLTIKDLASKYSVDAMTIHKHLVAAEIPRRPRFRFDSVRNHTKTNGHTQETKDKLRTLALRQFSNPEARALASSNQVRAMSEGRVSSISGLELRVGKALTQMGVVYKPQAPIRCPQTGRFVACVDFLLSDGRALEVNGTYWHCDPRVYPNGPLYASQRNTIKRYETKKSNLQKLGLSLLEVWELDLDADMSQTLASVLGEPSATKHPIKEAPMPESIEDLFGF